MYRKPTHTDQYIPSDSHHPTSVKRGLVKCLFDRADHIITNPQETSKERTHVRNALGMNGYSRRFIRTSSAKRNTLPKDQKEYQSFTVLPYIDGVSQQLKCRLEKHGIRTVFRSDSTLRKQLVRPKDPVPEHRRDGIVYNIPCQGCDKSYIGETARPVAERISEHKRDCRLRRTDSSAVAEHAWENHHQPNWEGIQCLAQERHWYTRRVKEAINIRLHPNNLNRDSGIDIPDFWMNTIRRHNTHSTGEKAGASLNQSRPDPPETASHSRRGINSERQAANQSAAEPVPTGSRRGINSERQTANGIGPPSDQ